MSYFYRDPATREMVRTLVERLSLYLFNQEAFLEIVSKGLAFYRDDGLRKTRLDMLKNGWVSMRVFHAMISGGQSYESGPVRFLWDCLERELVFVNTTGDMLPNSAFTHQINGKRLMELLLSNTLPNIFEPPASLAERYEAALLAVDVEKDGSPHRGSGFLLQGKTGPHVVTCKHNVDPQIGITDVSFTTAKGNVLQVGDGRLHPTLDVACYPVSELDGAEPVFWPGERADLFDEVFTLGFPMVPGAHGSLLGHRGEINGHVELYLGSSPAILISNLVSPGSSGCPVISRDGLCVGMTMRWAEAHFGEEQARFSLALPIGQISAFVGDIQLAERFLHEVIKHNAKTPSLETDQA